ncbi:MAG: endonuclease/exonuclease/phosphatase family protein [Methanobacteriaceae archaeon]|nr:endonuclease/exonuclease/phosphatase family protein [Methanobacteriaceae archaeon]
MKIINLNIRSGGSKRRNPLIIDYLLKNEPDLIILTEFIYNESGKQIIKELESHGYQTKPSNIDGAYGSFIASRIEMKVEKVEDRWSEIYLPEFDLYVLGAYFPAQVGKEKNDFWKKVLEYSEKNLNKNILIAGDFNSCSKDDSENMTEYNPQDLKKLESLNYIDLWKISSFDEAHKYTWFYHDNTGFRIDYAFVSNDLYSNIKDVSVIHDSNVRESKISDHLGMILEWEFC